MESTRARRHSQRACRPRTNRNRQRRLWRPAKDRLSVAMLEARCDMICGVESGPSNRRFSVRRQKVSASSDSRCYLTRPELVSDQGFHGQNSCPRGLRRAGQNGQKSSQKMRISQGMLSCGHTPIWPGGSHKYIYKTYLSISVHIYTRITHAPARTCVREGS